MARDAERSQRREADSSEEQETERQYESRDWTPRMLRSNYPRELIDLATEVDVMIRCHVRTRRKVRQHLVSPKLANSWHGINDWERDPLDRDNEQARGERKEVTVA
jgi:hypothetical protein